MCPLVEKKEATQEIAQYKKNVLCTPGLFGLSKDGVKPQWMVLELISGEENTNWFIIFMWS